MLATDLVEGMRDQSKFLDERYVIVFSYVINDLGNNIIRKDGRHRNVELLKLNFIGKRRPGDWTTV